MEIRPDARSDGAASGLGTVRTAGMEIRPEARPGGAFSGLNAVRRSSLRAKLGPGGRDRIPKAETKDAG